MSNRNIAIGVGVILLLYFFGRKKTIVDEMVDDAVDGGGGGGGIGGGGFPLIPPININTGTTTGTTTGANVLDGIKSSTPDAAGIRNPIEDQKPRDVVLAPEFTYTTAFAQRPLSIRDVSTNTFKNFAVGNRIEIATPKAGINFTHPKINPAQTLILGKDVDLMGVATPTGGGTTTGGTTTGGTTGGGASGSTGGTMTGGTLSGGTTTPRVGSIGTKSTTATSGQNRPPSGSL